MSFTIGYIKHSDNMFNKHLKPSLDKLSEDFELIGKPSSEGRPCNLYNQIIDESKNRFIIFLHEDISFNANMLKQIDNTIIAVKEFGVLALVGKLLTGKQVWSNSEYLHNYRTVDCCFFVIDKSTGIRFDAKTFDGLHMYGEDYAMQCIKKRLTNYSIYTNSNSSPKDIAHHSHTCRTVGYMWGDWKKYRNKFIKKWKIT